MTAERRCNTAALVCGSLVLCSWIKLRLLTGSPCAASAADVARDILWAPCGAASPGEERPAGAGGGHAASRAEPKTKVMGPGGWVSPSDSQTLNLQLTAVTDPPCTEQASWSSFLPGVRDDKGVGTGPPCSSFTCMCSVPM